MILPTQVITSVEEGALLHPAHSKVFPVASPSYSSGWFSALGTFKGILFVCLDATINLLHIFFFLVFAAWGPQESEWRAGGHGNVLNK